MTGTPADWERLLGEQLEYRVRVQFGRARTQPVRAHYEGRRLDLRLHEFFAAAPPEIADDLAAWLRSGRRARAACARLDRWIDEQLAALPKKKPRAVSITTRGDVHDLEPMARSLFETEFAGEFESRPPPQITWGRRGPSRARRSMQLGCYVRESNLVRMSPVLDQAAVPAWFVRFVLFHEILHAAMPAGLRPHGPEFRARERSYADYDAAVKWQARHLNALFRSARSGKPMERNRRPLSGVQGLFFRL